MSISLVSAGSATTGSQTASPDFGQSTTEGNFLVAFVCANSVRGEEETDEITCSDEFTWHPGTAASADYNQAAIFYKPNCGSGETAPSFSGNDNSSYVVALLAEFSGVSTNASTVLDQIAGYYGFPSGCACSRADSEAGELLVGMASWNGPNAVTGLAAGMTGSQGSSLSVNTLAANATGTPPQYVMAWAVNDSTLGSDAETFAGTFSSGSDNEPCNILAAFLPA